jgi:diguanylate cyclase (GGDEF)-like protein
VNAQPSPLSLVANGGSAPVPSQRLEELVVSYRRLADVFHDILAEQSLDTLLDRIADTLAELVPYDTLTIFEADEAQGVLVPVLARDQWAEKIMRTRVRFGQGITGWAVENREPVLVEKAHLDPRMQTVPGTPEDEPESLISIPLISRDSIQGALNMYRLGDDAEFGQDEFELARRFGDAAALALDNAKIRARLEHQAQTDSLTGLYNHRYFHERLREELRRISLSHGSIAVLMVDIDDFKRVNDIHGHGTGDEILRVLAQTLRAAVRNSDIVCRLGGEEFAVIVTGPESKHARQLAQRLVERVGELECVPAGRITVSVGVAEGPQHAMNPRELVACSEAAMMAAKARGKNQIVYYDDTTSERPETRVPTARDVRSIAHLKMLQSLSGKLNRLNDVREIGETIATELRSLIDYHNCRIFVVDGDELVPVAFHGGFATDVPSVMEALRCRVGQGITGRCAQLGESLLISDAARNEFAMRVPGTEMIEESLVAVPLRYGKRVIGVIVISKLGLEQFDEDDARLLEVLSGHAAVALENARLYEAQRREAESAKALLEFSRELASAEGLDEILTRIVELAAPIVGSPRTSVWLQDVDTGEIGAKASFGYDADDASRLEAMSYPGTLVDELLEGSEPFLFSPDDYGMTRVIDDASLLAAAPLTIDGGRHGFIIAAVPPAEEEDFRERKLRLLAGLAHQAKLALANAGNFESLEGTFLSTVEALANALEANDEYTSSHARWITDLALKVGAGLGLEAKALKRLELGALFHDIGKIGIPGSILSKPGRLTAEERTLIETHPELGEKIIAPIERLQEVCPIVRHCHERYDGDGYPDGRSGDEIPIESRIIFVCDAFHAMTTDRPYRKRLSKLEAIRRLQQGAGTQFDPRVVEVALDVIEDAHAADIADVA